MDIVEQGDSDALRASVAGGVQLERLLCDRGLVAGEPEHGLVLDLHEAKPTSWEELEELLVDAHRMTARAFEAGATVVYVLDEASLYGHRSTLQATLATGLLGGIRSVAVEGQRDGVGAHAVTLNEPDQLAAAADAVRWLLGASAATGQVIHCGTMHVGRPPV